MDRLNAIAPPRRLTALSRPHPYAATTTTHPPRSSSSSSSPSSPAPPFHLHFLDVPVSMVNEGVLTSPTLPHGALELCGPSASGKSHILLHLTMTAVLPHECTVMSADPADRHCAIPLHGRGRRVVYVDCDGRFDVQRLRHCMRAYVGTRLEQCLVRGRESTGDFEAEPHTGEAEPHTDKAEHRRAHAPTVDAVVSDALARVTVYRPRSTLDLLAVVRQLLNDVTEMDPWSSNTFASSSSAHPAYVMVDSLTAFHWMDAVAWPVRERCDPVSVSTTSTVPSSASPKADTPRIMPRVITLLEELSQKMATADTRIILTRTTLFQPYAKYHQQLLKLPPELSDVSDTRDRSIYGARWAAFVKYRFNVVRVSVPQQQQQQQQGSADGVESGSSAVPPTTFLLSKMVRPQTSVQQREACRTMAIIGDGQDEEARLWVEQGVLPWEIHADGIA